MWHVSAVVQALPSSQAIVLLANTQPVAGLQLSFVQMLLSLQTTAVAPVHVPAPQTSPAVQAFPSLQAIVLFACAQPVAGLQLSLVQTLLSLQFVAAPPTQAPAEHVSPVVHAFPSLQEAVLFAKTQPVAGLQLSLVQTLPSLQTTGVAPVHVPPPQTSPVVQAFPSLHEAVLFVCVQPAGVQLSSVQGLLSLQSKAAPEQLPPLQTSPIVQALPSSQAAVLFA